MTDGSGFIRKELSQATTLLKESGWKIKEGKLTENKKLVASVEKEMKDNEI